MLPTIEENRSSNYRGKRDSQKTQISSDEFRSESDNHRKVVNNMVKYEYELGELVDETNGLTTTHQGGKAYEIDALKQLRRFLILGSESGTFYVSQKSLTNLNIKAVQTALDEAGTKAIDVIIDVSDRGLAPNNDPALLALALAASYKSTDQNKQDEIRTYALANLSKVARISTHLFHFIAYVDKLRGWGRGLQTAIEKWYLDRSPLSLAQQVTKYQQRDGWSHRDVLRKAHVKSNTAHNIVLGYAVNGSFGDAAYEGAYKDVTEYLGAVEAVKASTDDREIVSLIEAYNLPREVLPTAALNSPLVWEALLMGGKGMPLGALLRNLGNLSKHGVIAVNSDGAKYVTDRLADVGDITRARIHPVDALKAKLVFAHGRGVLGSSTWTVNQRIVDALETTFYTSFGNVEDSGKRGIIALDVSGSMSWNSSVGGVPGLTPRLASACMAMVTVRSESRFEVVAFSSSLVSVNLSAHDSLDTVLQKIDRIPMGGTRCELPMLYAAQKQIAADYFIVYTDSETSGVNPAGALRDYRKKMQIFDSKLIVVAIEANQFSIADPRDPNMLDVVGFDSSAPAVMSSFIRGDLS